jgi:hypothetical protein
MQGAFATLATFGALYLTLHLIFRVTVEAVALAAIAIGWFLAMSTDPVGGAAAGGFLLAGMFFGFRVIPAQTLVGLGLPPSLARDHVRFDVLAQRATRSPRMMAGPLADPFGLDQFMHVGTLRMYNRAVFWALSSTCGHLFFLEIAPWFIAGIQILLTSFPVGFLFKRWLAQRGFAEA